MKKILFCLFALPVLASAQGTGLVTPVPFGSYGFLNGKATYARQDGLEEGTYLFPKAPSKANVKLRNGRSYQNLKIMIDLMENEMIFADSIGQIYSAVVPVEEVEFWPSDNVSNRTIFRTGFPAVDHNDENTFYEVLADGPVTLLRANKVSYRDKQTIERSISTRIYDTKQTIYAYDKKSGMKKVSKSKAELESLFAGNNKMHEYLASHKIKSDTDLVGAFDYYNSIH